jgi:hypothetical protein
MALVKGNPEALVAYRKVKGRALARTAPARKRTDRAKAAHNAGTAVKPAPADPTGPPA